MFKITSVVIIPLICVAGILYWLVSTPKTTKRQVELEAREHFNYETNLVVQKDSYLSELLLLRRVRDSEWQTSGQHTNYQVQARKEASMAVSTIRPDAYLAGSTENPRVIIGRYSDRGSGMHGWHVTMIKQGESDINFDRHQRYYVWTEKSIPKGFTDQGEPISDDPKRWFFAGLADLISKEKYNGYLEPTEGDK